MSINTLVAIQGGQDKKPPEYVDKYLDDIELWYEGNYGLTGTSWRDASGNNNNLTRSNTAYVNAITFVNGLKASQINAGSVAGWQYTEANPYFQTIMSNGYTYFAVFKSGGASMNGVIFEFGSATNKAHQLGIANDTNPTNVRLHHNTSTSDFARINQPNMGSIQLATAYGSSLNNLNLLLNGNQSGVVTTTSSTGVASSTPSLYMGSANNDSLVICEFIAVKTQKALSVREEFEGYLAHKWGFESELPGSHTYKASAPS